MATQSRVWLITGSSSGLGKAIIETLLADTNDRAIATCRNPTVLSYLTSQYGTNRLVVQKLDVTKPEEVQQAFAAGLKAFGTIDVVVNNAGYALIGEIEGIPEEDARQQFEVQFWGPVRVSKEALRIFREANPKGRGGRIFNISTIGGYMANPSLAYYSASKFALEGFTESLIKERQPDWNITGCIIEPGGFDSEWRGSSAKSIPAHPAYTDPSNPCASFRKLHEGAGAGEHLTFLNDAKKMARALYKLADEPKLPLRIQFGTESTFMVKTQALNTARDAETYAHIANSTVRDDMDGEKYVQDILLATGNFERNRT